MLNRVLASVMGTRHERERRRVQPLIDESNDHFERLQQLSEDELRAQTEKFRGQVRAATADLESKIAALKEAKHSAKDAAERERLDLELSGADGRGGVEGELRTATADVLEELLPEAF